MRVYNAHTDRKVQMFMDAFHATYDVFGWVAAFQWWMAAETTLDRECYDDGRECDS